MSFIVGLLVILFWALMVYFVMFAAESKVMRDNPLLGMFLLFGASVVALFIFATIIKVLPTS
jgi:hypothetical protein